MWQSKNNTSIIDADITDSFDTLSSSVPIDPSIY